VSLRLLNLVVIPIVGWLMLLVGGGDTAGIHRAAAS
jgi:hypothetical protein